MPELIVCTKCGLAKASEKFSRNQGNRSGRNSWCKDCFVTYRAAHREEVQKHHATYRAAHREEKRKYSAAWRARNPEYSAAYNAAHKKERRAYNAAWRAANPERIAILMTRARHKRRSREEQLSATLTFREWKRTLKAFGGKCAYCGGEGPFHKDHVVPVSKGGGYEMGNIVPACVACNQSKNSHQARSWMEQKAYGYEAFALKLSSLLVQHKGN